MLTTFVISLVLIFICVTVHYEALYRFDRLCQLLKLKGRLKVFAGSLWALFAHTVEVWCFAVGYYLMTNHTTSNIIATPMGESFNSFIDMVYFSFITYTSLGYGDLIPEGPVRFMAGTEALLGLVFIAWTASFLYLEMEKNWNKA